jgi:hypothetical protein
MAVAERKRSKRSKEKTVKQAKKLVKSSRVKAIKRLAHNKIDSAIDSISQIVYEPVFYRAGKGQKKRLLTALTKEAERVAKYAEQVSQNKREPIIVIGNIRTGVPYTFKIKPWQEQVREQLGETQFQQFLLEFRKKRAELKDEILSAFLTAREWIKKKKLKSLVFVLRYKFTSTGGEAEIRQAWKDFSRKNKELLRKNPVIIIVDSSRKFGVRDHPAALANLYKVLSRKGIGMLRQLLFRKVYYPKGWKRLNPNPRARIILLNPALRSHSSISAWHDDYSQLVGAINGTYCQKTP